jgi:hypothetical protein
MKQTFFSRNFIPIQAKRKKPLRAGIYSTCKQKNITALKEMQKFK